MKQRSHLFNILLASLVFHGSAAAYGAVSIPSVTGTQQFGAMIGANAAQVAQAACISRMQQFDDLLGTYICEHYNGVGYANSISQNSAHLLTLLRAVKRADFGEASVVYSSTILKLFHDKLKAAELVDDCVIEKTLCELPALLGGYFIAEQTETERLQDNVRRMLLASFTSHLSTISPKGGNMLDALASRVGKDVATKLDAQASNRDNVVRLRHLTIRFVEHLIGKSGFQFTSYESFVPSLRAIAHQLTRLVDAGIIDHADDYDSLVWSLVHRACYFLELAGSAFPMAFYEELEADLQDGEIIFLEDAELDKHITSKKQTFIDALTKAKFAAMAYHQAGIISRPMV